MIRVIEVISDTNIGGAGTVLLTCLANFDRRCFSVSVALPKGSLLTGRVLALGYPVHEMEITGDASYDSAAVSQYCRLFRREKPDIVHTHASLSARIAAFLCGVPSRIYTRHSTFDPPKKLTTFPGKQVGGLFNSSLSTRIVAVSESTKKNLTDTGVNPAKIRVIINGADPLPQIPAARREALRAVLGIPDGVLVFGMSARLEAVKGHEYFLRAAAKLVADGYDARFLIMGGGSCEESLRSLTDQLHLKKYVIFTGHVSEVAAYVAVFDVIVNCSYGTEATSMALAEAMSLSKPVIASDFGGNPYLVRNGENGYVVPQKDPAALADRLELFCREPERIAILGKGAYARYESELTGVAMTAQYERLYKDEFRTHCRRKMIKENQ